MKKPRYIKEKIAVLEAAKNMISMQQCRGLCYAVGQCNVSVSLNFTAVTRARNDLGFYTRQAIDSYIFLEHWQQKNGFTELRTREQTLQDRLDWIDWMIADYQKWGVK